MDENIILNTDSYKVTHWLQYPPKTQYVYLYFESRGGKWDEIVFFGLQYIIKRYLEGQVITKEKIKAAEELFKEHFGSNTLFNRKDWKYILKKHNGRLPIIIKAVPEGSVVKSQNVLMTVENTDPSCFWLASYMETLLSNIWYPCTVATQSRELKKLIGKYLELTGKPKTATIKLVDFGARGSTSPESAAIGGGSHLVNFKSSENVIALNFLNKYYHAGMESSGFPANEHSTVISWGRDDEVNAYGNMLRKFPTGIVIIVCDSYNIFHVCENILARKLKNEIQNHEGTIFIRPDSGNPAVIIPRLLNILGSKFGYNKNKKGYKVLPPYLGIMQGDGIEYKSLENILKAIKSSGWSIDNLTFGSGGGLLQKVNRDTLKFAFNCSSVIINGISLAVSKNPTTDFDKRSKFGRFALVRKRKRWVTINEAELNTQKDELKTVFKNGKLMKEEIFSDIKKRAELKSLRKKFPV